VKRLEDYLYYHEIGPPDIKIYLGDMIASWYNTRNKEMLWVNEKVTNKVLNILKSVRELANKAGIGLEIKFPSKVEELGHYAYTRISECVRFVVLKNQSDTTLTETQQIMNHQTSRLLAVDATWSLTGDLLASQRWLKRAVLSVAWLLKRLEKCRLTVNEDTCFLVSIRTEQGYARYA